MKIILNESQLFTMICEAASLNDIYAKYYSGIDRETFNTIITSDPTWREEKPDKMGKYGKWLLQLYINRKLKIEDLYKAKEYLTYFIKYNNKVEIKDINKIKSLPELYNIVSEFMSNPQMATSNSDEVRKAKEGAEKIYEDENWMIIVPHTREASCYYGKGTQWCTAADKSENMFDHYNDQGKLFINIRKSDGEKFQFHFETDSFMDATDEAIESPIYTTINMGYEVINFYKEYVGKHFVKLVETVNEVDSSYIKSDNNNRNIAFEVLRICHNPITNEYYASVYNDSRDEIEIIATDLEKCDVSYVSRNLDTFNFAAIKNKNGYYTLIGKDMFGNYRKISDDYVEVYPIEEVFEVDDEYKHLVYTLDNDGVLEIYDFAYGIHLLKCNASGIVGKGTVPYSNIIYFKFKSGDYDLINIYVGETIDSLRPISDEYPFNEEYCEEGILYMYDSSGEMIKIFLDDFTYDYVDEEEEFQ